MAFQLPNYPGDNEGLFVFSKTIYVSSNYSYCFLYC